jgi:hypothetical protein
MNDDNDNDDNYAVSCMKCHVFILKTSVVITTDGEGGSTGTHVPYGYTTELKLKNVDF